MNRNVQAVGWKLGPAALLALTAVVALEWVHGTLHQGHGEAGWAGIARELVLVTPLAWAGLHFGSRAAARAAVWAGYGDRDVVGLRPLLQGVAFAGLLAPVALLQVLSSGGTGAAPPGNGATGPHPAPVGGHGGHGSHGGHGGHGGHEISGVTGQPGDPGALLVAAQLLAHVLVAFLLTAAVLGAAGWLRDSLPAAQRRLRSTRARQSLVGMFAGGAVMLAPLSVPAGTIATAGAAEAAEAAEPRPTCDASSVDRDYDVAAINTHIAYNRWGQGNENAMIYVLQHDKLAVRDWHKPLGSTSSNRRLRPRPLVIRANEGECVAVRFTNELDAQQGEGLPANPHASMYIRGVPFDVQSSAGTHVGYNDETIAAPGETLTYYWSATKEGIYFFNDSATPAGSEADGGSLSAGLYGAFVVEPAGSTWTDPVSGDALYTGTRDQSGELYISAMITEPNGRSFREFIQLAQDELPHTGTFAFNYGSEDVEMRQQNRCPDCVGEETTLSSWAYGDPALVKLASGFGPWLPGSPAGEENCGLGTQGFDADSCFTANVSHAYKGDATKIRYGMAGVKETHVFHLHAHTWLAEDKDHGAAGHTSPKPGLNTKAESNTIDSQTFGPMEMFTADLIYGAGSKNKTVGDAIFHCHLYPHFVKGFWGLLRVHDVRENGSGSTPDGVKVAAVKSLPNVGAPALPTAQNPGFPRFIPGKFGWRAPQPPLGIMEDGAPATRYVAGQELDDDGAETQLERAAMDRLSGGDPKPGAPFGDPCPSGSRQVTYKVSVIQTKAVYNERGDFDPQARILVLTKDVDAILSGRRKPEPLFVRVNAGDCINWELTNHLPNYFGNDAFQQLVQTNIFGQHIHLVKYDVMASDGASNGWNYQQGAFSDDQADFNKETAAGTRPCGETTGCRLPMPATYDPFTSSNDVAPGQTIRERWFADYELRTVFTHDHHFAAVDQNRGQYGAVLVEPAGMDFRNPVTGRWFQPINNPAHGTACGSSCEADAAGTAMDVIGPGPDDDFREFGLAIADFVPLTRGGGNPQNRDDVINPPAAPEPFPDDDPGTMAVNYRNAPLELRQFKNGQRVDPAYSYSSHVWGDPMTPVLQTYNGDNVRMRLIQGAQEEQHTMKIHGVRWKREPDDPQSHFVDALPVGTSEAFNFEMPRLGCAAGQDCRGDYLYTSAAADDTWLGMWGLLRVNGGRVPDLLPLPDNPPGQAGSVPSANPDAVAPPARTGPGNPCPTGVPRKRFDIVAMQTKLTFNEAGDHDPFGLVYVLAEDEAAVRAGKQPEPLVIRANEGDCVEVTLRNKLTAALQQHRGEGDAPLPGLGPNVSRVPGLRVSLHPGMLKYDVRGSDGAAVGFNRDQTVAPGGSMLYRWYADKVTDSELGAVNLLDYGDVLGHRHHGLFAGLVVEPKGATWHDPQTGAPLASGTRADIRVPGKPDFRENVVFFEDGLNLRDAAGNIIEDPGAHPPTPEEPEPAEGLDPEDSGEKGFNYRNEPFRHRLGYEPVDQAGQGSHQAHVYDSQTHGDPATPMMRAYEGDQVKVRVMMSNDKPRQHTFGIGGHSFGISADDPGTRHVGSISGLGPAMAVNADMGVTGKPGDYLYGCDVGLFHRSGGLWGMLRVYPKPDTAEATSPTKLTEPDDPRAGGHPILPLELDQVEATVFKDTNRNGARDAGEALLKGAEVEAVGAGGTARATSGADGRAFLSVRTGTHALTATLAGRSELTATSVSVTTTGNNDRRTAVIGLAPPSTLPNNGTVRVTSFVDTDKDGRHDPGEPTVSGVPVRLLDGTAPVANGTTDGTGAVRLDALPGSYTVAATPPSGHKIGALQAAVTLIEAGQVVDVGLPLLRTKVAPGKVRVQVYLDRDRDGRRDRGERPVKGAHAAAYRNGHLVARTVTGANGRGVLRLPAASLYRLQVSPPKKFGPRVRNVRVRNIKAGTTRQLVLPVVRRR